MSLILMKLAFCVMLFTFISFARADARTYVVNQSHPAADDGNSGTADQPLKTVSAAAAKVEAGDMVVIHDGIYRERVQVKASGTAESPIVFSAAVGSRPVLTGAEPLKGPWEDLGDGLFRTELPATLNNQGWLFVDGIGAEHVDMLELTDEGAFATGSFVRGAYPAGRRMLEAVGLLPPDRAMFTVGSFGRHWTDPPVRPDAMPAAGELSAPQPQKGIAWRPVETDASGVLDLEQAIGEPIGNSVVFALVYVYSPSDQPGSLRKPSGRRGEDSESTFTGRFEPSLAPEMLGQPMRVWVNGQPVRWEGRQARAMNLNLRAGWNTVLVMMSAEELGPWRMKMGITANPYGRPSDVSLHVQADRPVDMDAAPAADASNGLLPGEENDMRGMEAIGQWLVAGPFESEPSDGRLYVWLADGAPQQREMEWATRSGVFHVHEEAAHVHLRGITFRHAANRPQEPVVTLGPWGVVDDCEVSDSLGRGILTSTAPDAIIRSSRVLRHGCIGIGGRLTRIQILNNDLMGNNWLRFSHAWESGGMKNVYARDSVIRGNRVMDNEAWGIWLDWDCVGNRIENNVCINNRAAGIFLEASRRRNVIANNIVIGTRMGGADWGDGIYMHDTSDTLIAHNLAVGNAQFGIRVNLRTSRTLDGKEVESSYNTVVNNIVADNGAAGLHIPVDRERQWGNRSDSNILAPRPQDEAVAQSSLGPMEEDDRMDLFGPMGATISNAPYLPLSLWQRLGFDHHSVAGTPLFIAAESGDWRPASNCPSLAHPVPTQAEVPEDFDGNRRSFPTTFAGPFQYDRRAASGDER